MTLSLVIWVIRKCVHNGCPRCSQRSTKNIVLHVVWHFWFTITRKETACWAILWLETRHGCPISHLNHNSSLCTRSILACRKGKSSSTRFNKEDHVHHILGQTRCSLGRTFGPRQNNKFCCLLWNAEEAEACNSKRKVRNTECYHSFALW